MTDELKSFKEKTNLEWKRKRQNENWWPLRSVSGVDIGLLKDTNNGKLCLQVETYKREKHDLLRLVAKEFSGQERTDRRSKSGPGVAFLWCDITPGEFSEKTMEIARFLQVHKESVGSS